MSSVWDDPELNDEEELTPVPQIPKAETPLGLSPERIEQLAEQVIEKVVREIVPELAERIIREEIARLTDEPST